MHRPLHKRNSCPTVQLHPIYIYTLRASVSTTLMFRIIKKNTVFRVPCSPPNNHAHVFLVPLRPTDSTDAPHVIYNVPRSRPRASPSHFDRTAIFSPVRVFSVSYPLFCFTHKTFLSPVPPPPICL